MKIRFTITTHTFENAALIESVLRRNSIAFSVMAAQNKAGTHVLQQEKNK